jgi:hypothetical protein
MTQTAVEWLDEQIQERVIAQDVVARKLIIEISMEDYMNIKIQAKEMEKQQIYEAFYEGEENAHKYKSSPTLYYNETYGQLKQRQ